MSNSGDARDLETEEEALLDESLVVACCATKTNALCFVGVADEEVDLQELKEELAKLDHNVGGFVKAGFVKVFIVRVKLNEVKKVTAFAAEDKRFVTLTVHSPRSAQLLLRRTLERAAQDRKKTKRSRK